MKRFALPIAAGMILTLAGPSMARQTVQTANWRSQTATEGGLADGTGTSAETIFRQVKDNDKKGKNGKRPPGWDKGKKTGWGDRNVPPGQARKDRDRDDRDRDNRDRNDRDRRDDRVDRGRERGGRNGGTVNNTLTGVVVNRASTFNRRITVRLNDGRTLRFDVPRDARITRGGRAISVHEIRSGQRVQMRVTRTGTNTYRVHSINVS